MRQYATIALLAVLSLLCTLTPLTRGATVPFAFADAARVHAAALEPPPAPASLTAREDTSAVHLNWLPVAGATAYHIYRSYLSGDGYALLAETADAHYTDAAVQNGTQYYYIVRAVRDGLAGPASAEVSAIPHWRISGLLIQEPPSIIHTLVAGQPTETVYGRVRVKHETVKPGPIEGILMEVGFGPAGTLPATWSTWQPMTFNRDYAPATANVLLKEFEEWGGALYPVAVGEYDYLIRASATRGREWIYSGLRAGRGWPGKLTVVPRADVTPPAAPTNLRVTATTPASIALAWDANAETDIYGYEIYHRRLCGVPVGSWHAIALVTTGTTYVDSDVMSECNFAFYVLAVDTSLNRSPASNYVEAIAESRLVQVTFNVTVPAATPAGDIVYLPGDLAMPGPWDPALFAMTKVGESRWSVTLALPDGTALEYKYTRGSWDTAEWWGAIAEPDNRTLGVTYGSDGVQVVEDDVALWRDPLLVSANPAPGATGVDRTAPLTVVFTRPLQAGELTSQTVTLVAGSLNVVGAVTFDDATSTLTFTPNGPLKPAIAYTLTIAAGIHSDANGPLQSPVVIRFTTGE